MPQIIGAESTRRARRSGDAGLLGKWSSASWSCAAWAPRYQEGRAGQGFCEPHRNPMNETANSGTLVMRVKVQRTAGDRPGWRVSWLFGFFSRCVLSG
jgi:hypothetical protein